MPSPKRTSRASPASVNSFKRAIDGGLPDAGIFLLDQTIKIFAGKMLFRAQKHIQNQVALGRAFESLLLDMFEKNFLLFSHAFLDHLVCRRSSTTILTRSSCRYTLLSEKDEEISRGFAKISADQKMNLYMPDYGQVV